jgi:hypothetical protein
MHISRLLVAGSVYMMGAGALGDQTFDPSFEAASLALLALEAQVSGATITSYTLDGMIVRASRLDALIALVSLPKPTRCRADLLETELIIRCEQTPKRDPQAEGDTLTEDLEQDLRAQIQKVWREEISQPMILVRGLTGSVSVPLVAFRQFHDQYDISYNLGIIHTTKDKLPSGVHLVAQITPYRPFNATIRLDMDNTPP